MSTKIVEMYDNTPRAGTSRIAEGFNREHKVVLELINRYISDFEDFGSLKMRKIATKGRSINEYLLNEEQFMLLGSYMRNNTQVREFKKRLIKQYSAMRRQLDSLHQHKDIPEYQAARAIGKFVRKQATDTMQEFVAYAEKQGSTSPEMYYMLITKMANGLLFIAQGKFKNLRDVLSAQQLMTISSAEQIIFKGLHEGMKAGKYYKDIYQDVKRRTLAFAELHGQSEVISKQLTNDEEQQWTD